MDAVIKGLKSELRDVKNRPSNVIDQNNIQYAQPQNAGKRMSKTGLRSPVGAPAKGAKGDESQKRLGDSKPGLASESILAPSTNAGSVGNLDAYEPVPFDSSNIDRSLNDFFKRIVQLENNQKKLNNTDEDEQQQIDDLNKTMSGFAKKLIQMSSTNAATSSPHGSAASARAMLPNTSGLAGVDQGDFDGLEEQVKRLKENKTDKDDFELQIFTLQERLDKLESGYNSADDEGTSRSVNDPSPSKAHKKKKDTKLSKRVEYLES